MVKGEQSAPGAPQAKELLQQQNKNAEVKICFFCGNSHNAKKYRFWARNYQLKFWVCTFCYFEKKKAGINIQQLLDSQPLDSQARVSRFGNPWQKKEVMQ